QRREDRNYLRLVYPSPLTSAPRDPLEDAEPPTRPATCRGVQSYSSTSARTEPFTSYGFVKWCLFAPILGMHVRLEFDHEKLHDLQMPIRCGEVEWCPAVITLGIHVRLEFDHEKLHDLQMSRTCGSVQCWPTVRIPTLQVRLEFA